MFLTLPDKRFLTLHGAFGTRKYNELIGACVGTLPALMVQGDKVGDVRKGGVGDRQVQDLTGVAQLPDDILIVQPLADRVHLSPVAHSRACLGGGHAHEQCQCEDSRHMTHYHANFLAQDAQRRCFP